MNWSPIRFAFLPVQRRDFRLLGAQWQVIPKSIARVLMRAELLPNDYLPPPAKGLKWREEAPGEAIQLSLRAVLAEATGHYFRWLAGLWREGTARAAEPGLLVWLGAGMEGWSPRRREIVDRSAVLATCWGSYLSLLLGLLWAAGKAMVGTAHAATLAAAPTPNGDVALAMLGQLFGGFGMAGGLLTAMCGTLLSTLGVMCFSVATVSALVHGVTLWADYVISPDNFSSSGGPGRCVWLFIRAVVAVPLLFPLVNGLGAGQEIFLWAAGWGSDKATVAWTAASNLLSSASLGNIVSPPSDPRVAESVAGMFLMEVCQQGVAQGPGDSSDLLISTQISSVSTNNAAASNQSGNQTSYDLFHRNGALASGGLAYCGSFTTPTLTDTGFTSVNTAIQNVVSWLPSGLPLLGDWAFSAQINKTQANDFYKAQTQVKGIAKSFVAHVVPSICAGTGVTCIEPESSPSGPSYSSQLASVMKSYQTSLGSDLMALMPSATTDAQQAMAANMSKGGWAAAGIWAFQLAQVNGSINRMMNHPPTIHAPSPDLRGNALESVILARQILPTAGSMSGVGLPDIGANPSWFTSIFTGLMNKFQVDSQNPIASVASIGNTVIFIGETVFTLDLVATVSEKNGLISGDVPASLVSKLTDWSGLLTVTKSAMKILQALHLRDLSLALIVIGCGLAYICPLLPALRFIFSVLGWLIAVIECVVLVPLMLVLMVSSHGDGLLSPMAKACFWTIVGTVLRPILILAGYLFGLALVFVFMAFVNLVLLQAYRGGHDWGVTFFLTFIVVYLVVAFAVFNACFKLPDHLAHAGYRWLGANAGGDRDDAGGIQSAVSGLAWRLSAPFSKPRQSNGR